MATLDEPESLDILIIHGQPRHVTMSMESRIMLDVICHFAGIDPEKVLARVMAELHRRLEARDEPA
jgi:hypothetical protein